MVRTTRIDQIGCIAAALVPVPEILVRDMMLAGSIVRRNSGMGMRAVSLAVQIEIDPESRFVRTALGSDEQITDRQAAIAMFGSRFRYSRALLIRRGLFPLFPGGLMFRQFLPRFTASRRHP